MRAIPGYPRRSKCFPDSHGWLLVIDTDDGVPEVVGVEGPAPAEDLPLFKDQP